MNKYRVFERLHYGPEKEFPSYKERMEYLFNYANEARLIYERNKDKPEEIKNKEELKKFEQYSFYKEFESDLMLIEIFREKARKACRIATVIRNAEEMKLPKKEINSLQVRFAVAKAEIQELIEGLGPLLEYAHRRVLENEKKYRRQFNRLSKEEAELKILAELPSPQAATAQEVFEQKYAAQLDPKTKKEIIDIAQGRDYLKEDVYFKNILEDPRVLANLKELSEATGEDLLSFAEESLQKEEKEEKPRSKEEINKKLEQIQTKLDELWESDRTRYYVYQRYLERLIHQDQLGEPVLEIPSLVKLMNKLDRWERQHQETPIGGVLIGPPGTGKSLGVEHYLAEHPEHKKKGPPVIIDMSQETTEFILLGGEAIEVSDKANTVEIIAKIFDHQEEINRKLKDLEVSKPEKQDLISEKENLDKKIEDIIQALLAEYVEFRKEKEKLEEGGVEKVVESYAKELVREEGLSPKIRAKLSEKIENALSNWQALELGKIMYGNGWRDGIILKALKEGRDIIINEYNNFRIPPDALRQLFQTAYGGKWFFAGTSEEYPVHSRIYLTANAGSSAEKFFYDTAQVTTAFESRLPPPIEVELPSTEEELLIVQTELSDTNKKFLVDKDIEVKLQATGALKDYSFNLQYNEEELICYIFQKLIPQLRGLSKEAPKEVPSLDLRHVNRFCRDLVNPFTRERTRTSVEEAFARNFLKPFLSNPTAFETLANSGIIEQMYKIGLLHNRKDEEARSLLNGAIAKKEGLEWSSLSDEARKNVLTKIEERLQKFDAELIENLEKQTEKEWSEMVKNLKEGKKALILNPYLEETFSKMFSKEFPRPEARSF